MITSWNNGAFRLYGYTGPRPSPSRVCFSTRRPQDEIDSILRQVRDGRPSSASRRGTCAGRSIVDVSVTFSPILDTSNGMIGVSASRGTSRSWFARGRKSASARSESDCFDSTAEAIYGIDPAVSAPSQFLLRAPARLFVAGVAHREADAPADSHTRPDGTPYAAEHSPITRRSAAVRSARRE